jgi:hypothetical protein
MIGALHDPRFRQRPAQDARMLSEASIAACCLRRVDGCLP